MKKVSHPAILLLLVLAILAAAVTFRIIVAGPTCRLVPLEITTVPHAPTAINDRGWIAGWHSPESPLEKSTAFLWDPNNGLRDLGTLGGTNSFPSDINNNALVVGNADANDGLSRAFVWTHDSGMTDLGTLGGRKSRATAVNDHNQVVGWADTAEGEVHAFLWTKQDGMTDLGTLYGIRSYAQDIDNAGRIVGCLATPAGTDHAFLWTPEKGITDLVGPDGPSSYAEAINNHGHIVGSVFTPNTGNYSAFLWTPEEGLKVLPLSTVESYVESINDSGLMIGHLRTDRSLFRRQRTFSFLRTTSGRIIDLSTFATSDRAQVKPRAINSTGCIAAQIDDPAATPRASAVLIKQK